MRRKDPAGAGSLLLLGGVGVIAILAVSGGVLYYLGLAARIPFTPGAMCVFGVLRAGPPALRWVEAGFPTVMVLAGAGVATYLLEHRAGDPSGRTVRGVLTVGALAAFVHAGTGLWAWHHLLTPPPGQALSVSCCTTVFDVSGTDIPGAAATDLPTAWLWGSLAGSLGGLAVLGRPGGRSSRGFLWGGTMLTAGGLVVAGPAVLLGRWAPKMMGLIDHHCPYCLLQRVPAAAPAVLLAGLGLGCVAWGGWVACLGAVRPDLRGESLRMDSALARAGFWLVLSAAGMLGAYALGRGIGP
ncbi:hypothetical protein [Deferrisoma palaeochoriense]